ncbi:MAG TPA: twin-arginine translocation signal domain-containing protein [Candidatus Hydrogenedentes bacterium]|nr:twin-arginine translocation signal domain-containing protein [Candidatus Hydrogenedentota bacterium]
MDTKKTLTGCIGCDLSRRGFLAAGCAACAGVAGILSVPNIARAASDAVGKVRIRVIYALHSEVQAQPDWPNIGFNFKPTMDFIMKTLTNALPNFEFIPSMANGQEQAKQLIKEDKKANIDGYLVYQMNAWNQVVQPVAETKKPVLYADFQYGGSGGFLVYTAAFLRKNTPNVGFVASSNIEDLVEAVKCFELVKKGGTVADFTAATARLRVERTLKPRDRACTDDPVNALSPQDCLNKLKSSKILAYRNAEGGADESFMDIPVLVRPFSELNDAWKTANKDEAKEIVKQWQKNASMIEGVSPETLETCAAMYLAEKAMLKKHGADAITINCLGGFYGGQIHAYPCLGFHELCNEGLVGACECDVRSTASMLVVTALSQGRPGYISDPVLDTAKRQIIYAHCVASNKPFGPQGKKNSFEILTHSEDRQGASVRSMLPVGFMTTTVEFAPERKEILFHQAKSVDNDLNDRACRTKLAAEPVGDFEKLFTMWDQWGWHRVTVYGDLKAPLFALADTLGYKVIQEA